MENEKESCTYSMINIINRIYMKTKKPRKKCIKNVNDN